MKFAAFTTAERLIMDGCRPRRASGFRLLGHFEHLRGQHWNCLIPPRGIRSASGSAGTDSANIGRGAKMITPAKGAYPRLDPVRPEGGTPKREQIGEQVNDCVQANEINAMRDEAA